MHPPSSFNSHSHLVIMKLSLALAVPLALLHITSVNSRGTKTLPRPLIDSTLIFTSSTPPRTAPASSRVRRHSFGRRDDHLAAGGEDHHGGGGDAQLEVAPPAGYESSAAPAESSITYDNGSYDSAKYAGSGETWTGDASASYETTAAAEGYGAATPTEAPVAHETTDAPPAAHETTVDVKYGSGSWGNVEGGGEYDACVQKCQAKYTGASSPPLVSFFIRFCSHPLTHALTLPLPRLYRYRICCSSCSHWPRRWFPSSRCWCAGQASLARTSPSHRRAHQGRPSHGSVQ